MDLKELYGSLQKHEKNLNELLETVQKKQIALISMSHQGIEDSIQLEEKLLIRVKEIEKERQSALDNLTLTYNTKFNSTKLSDVVEKLKNLVSEDELKSLSKFENKIKNLAEMISDVNNQNMFLIQHSKRFINETINTLLSNNKKSIVDRKI
ncbi:MAG: flagellar protein FlgN [Melioribacteraceae bacterium]|nr:flagellar protein FlgN [Melioribacteraceae bacterium]